MKKEDLISMLNEMNTQMDQLEASVRSQMETHYDDWLNIQEKQLDFCGQQLGALERKINSLNERNENKHASVRLEWSLSN